MFKGLSLERLRSLLDVADAGGITRAAKGEPTRQSQLSRQLGELEQYFGRPLTERRGGRVALTSFGRQVVEHARFTLAGLASLREHANAAPPLFTLGAGDALLHWLVIPRLPRIAKAEPHARFRVIALPAEPLGRALEDGEVDLALLRGDATPPGMHARRLGSVDHALFVPKAIAPRGVKADELIHHVPLALQTSDVDFRTRFREQIDVRLSCETFPQCLRAVTTGAFAAILPTLARTELPAARYLEVPLARLASNVSLAYAPRLISARAHAERIVATVSEQLKLG
ncbi:MAG: LysR family transcriptional regulator [Polyangiales bacterium]